MAAPPTTAMHMIVTTSISEKSAYSINPQTSRPYPQSSPYPGPPPSYAAATAYPVQPTQAAYPPQHPPDPNKGYPAAVPQS